MVPEALMFYDCPNVIPLHCIIINYVLGFLYLYIIHVCFVHIQTNILCHCYQYAIGLKKEIFTNPELQSRYLFISIENVLVCVQ